MIVYTGNWYARNSNALTELWEADIEHSGASGKSDGFMMMIISHLFNPYQAEEKPDLDTVMIA